MAEIIGLLGSIAGLIDIAAKVSVGLVKVAREIGAAGQEIRVIARHTNLISNVLSNLHTLMRKRVHATESSLRCEILLEDALQHCLEILNDCERLIRIFEPLIEKSGRRRTRATLRIRMVFEKSRFMAHGDALEKLTGILTLLVTSMNYFHSTESNTTRQTSESLKVQVESSIMNVDDSCSARLNVTQLLTYPRAFGERLSTRAGHETPRSESNTQNLIDLDDGTESTTTSIHQDTINTEEEAQLEAQSDSSTIDIDVGPTEEGEGNHEGEICDSEGNIVLGEDLDDLLDKEFAFADLEEFLEPYMSIKALQKKTVQFAQAILEKATEEEHGLITEDDDLFSDARVEQAKSERDEREENEENNEELEVLRLRDVRGQIYNLPFETAKTWEGVNTLLLEIYAGQPSYTEKLHHQKDNYRFQRSSYQRPYSPTPSECQGSERDIRYDPGDDDLTIKRFQLFGPDGHPILPRVWHQTVEPSDLITMRFADNKLNGPGSHPVSLMEKGVGWLRSWWTSDSRIVSKEGKEKIRFVRKKEFGAKKAVSIADTNSESGSDDFVDD